MPITQSAKKALRQSKTRHEHNVIIKTHFKDEIKELKKLVAAKDIDGAKRYLPNVYQALDKGAKSHVIEKNTASRLKSRLTKLVNKSAAVTVK